MSTVDTRAEKERSLANEARQWRMQTEVIGDGPPLALIGGGLTGWLSWEPHAERLAGTRTVARFQLLNVQYGLEERALPDGYDVTMESAALAGGLDALDWMEPVDLVVWSYGAVIALDFALSHPTRVRTLTLIEPPARWVLGDSGHDDPDVQALHAIAPSMGGDDVTGQDLARFVRTVGLCPPDAEPRELPQWPIWMEHRRSLRAATTPLEHTDEPTRLRAFDRPVLLVTGTDTAPFLRRVHETLAAHLPRARSVEMPAGHAPQIVSFDRFLSELERLHKTAD